ncbi:MAG: TauD/TfdA family dioxygenase [Acetobacteraceae bacterium]|jgi:alpha-ketoglutarate-dependent 2,4-dichlorophenoxyacetate dioxygenase
MIIAPIGDGFAAECSDLDITQPLPDAAIAAIEAGMDRYAVLVFHDQPLTDDAQRAFTRRFGPLEVASGGHVTTAQDRRLPLDMQDASNLDQHQRPLARDDRRRMFNLGNRLWHSDSSFRPLTARYSLLSGRIVVPYGGRTEFADMRAAYDALDHTTKAEVKDLVCEHSLMFSRGVLGFTALSETERAMFAPVQHRLVCTHPVTGRKSLFLSAHAGTILGWPVPEARAFLRDLNEHATQRRFVYSHAWRRNDLVMWDNRTTMHRVTRFDESLVRDMRRTTVAGVAA